MRLFLPIHLQKILIFFVNSYLCLQTSKRELAKSERRHHLQYLITLMLPFLNKLSIFQKLEIEFEATVQGMNLALLRQGFCC